MELAFATKDLRKICEREREARKMLGADVAASLHKRLADVEAADSVYDLPWLGVEVKDDGAVRLEFHEGYHLVAMPNHRNNPVTDAGKIDWKAVDRIKLIAVEQP